MPARKNGNPQQKTAIPAVPLRTPMHAATGETPASPDLTRPWVVFFEQLVGALQGIGGQAASILQPVFEPPIGTIDGTNTVFTLTSAPLASWLVLRLCGALESPYLDYTLSGKTITYATAPQPGDDHVAWYFRAAGATETPATRTKTNAVSTAGQGKILYIGTGSAPANWYTNGFNDSAWAAPVAQAGATLGSPVGGSSWITDTSGDRAASAVDLYRLTFSLPAGATAATLAIAADNFVNAVYLNGNSIPAPTTSTGSVYPPQTMAIPLKDLLSGQTNVLAISFANDTSVAPNPMSLSFALEVTS